MAKKKYLPVLFGDFLPQGKPATECSPQELKGGLEAALVEAERRYEEAKRNGSGLGPLFFEGNIPG